MALEVVSGPVTPLNWSKNPFVVKLHTDVDLATYSVKIVIIISINYNGYQLKPIYLDEFPDDDGNAQFILDGIIDEALENGFEEPSLQASIVKLSNTPVTVGIDCAEYTDDSQTDNFVLCEELVPGEEPYVFYRGGFDTKTNYHGIEYFSAIHLADTPNIPFLNWAPKQKWTDKTQWNLLYYLNHNLAAGDQLKVFLKIYNETTLINSAYKFSYTSGMPSKAIGYFSANWNNLGIDALLAAVSYTGIVTHYTVQMCKADNTPISEIRAYWIDNSYKKNKTYLLYQNSLNAFEDIRFTGEVEIKGDNDRSVSTVRSNVNSPITERQTFSVNETAGKKVNTGYLSPIQINALRELLLSPRIFELGNNNCIYKIELTEKTKSLLKSNDLLNGFAIEYRYVFTDRVYSPDLSHLL